MKKYKTILFYLMLFTLLANRACPGQTDLSWSTLLGGSRNDAGRAVALDEKGYLYVAGQTESPDFPTTPGVFDEHLKGTTGQADIFIVKLDPSGSGLVYATLLGGSLAEACEDIALDGSNNLCLTGTTWSPDFPTTPEAFDTDYHGGTDLAGDVFVVKLNSMGTGLIYSTLLGGSRGDRATGIALDASENICLTGETRSSDFPVTAGALDMTYGGGDGDAFVTKLHVCGSQLIFSTFLGGAHADVGRDIAVDQGGRVVVAGDTELDDFPASPGRWDSTHTAARGDVFISKLSSAGDGLIYSVRLGGSREETVGSIALDHSGCAYVSGRTNSPDFPVTAGAFDRTPNHRLGVLQGDAFVAKINPSGTELIYSTYLGGPGPDQAFGIAVDAAGSAYLCGQTEAAGFPTTPGAFDTIFHGQADVFFSQLDPSGSDLVYSTILGGRGLDHCNAIVLDRAGNAFLVGQTESANFPVISQALRSIHHGFDDVFVTRFGAARVSTEPDAQSGPVPANYALFQNYPNPFNTSTVLRFDVPRNGQVILKVFDTLGRDVRTLTDRYLQAGSYTISWNGRNNSGKEMASGVYFSKLEAGGVEDVVKMVMMK